MDFTLNRLKKLDSSSFADIHQGLAHNFYDVREHVFSGEESELADFLIKEIQKGSVYKRKLDGVPASFNDDFFDEVVSFIQLNNLNEKLPSKENFSALAAALVKLVKDISFVKQKELFAEYVLHNSIGLKQLAFFSIDPDLEELMINSPELVFVFHKKFGMCKTNISISEKDLTDSIQRISLTIGRDFSMKSPLLDARLPDGSRVNATLSDLSPAGATLTIRKFSSPPLTILDLIDNQTISSEAAAFLWVLVDGFGVSPQNVLVAGGSASGKTTFLNILSNFVRLNERIVSIEDTVELSLLNRENWIPFESRASLGSELSMDSLLKNAMRMRPDRIIVGEMRGSEALTFFTAMDTGHEGCLATIHANNASEVLVKLRERPLSVPEAMLPLLNIIVVMQRCFSKETGMQRRVTQIVELSRMDNRVLSGSLFEFDDKSGKLKRSSLSGVVVEKIAQKNSITKQDVLNEVRVRAHVLGWMLAQGIRNPSEILEVIETYYYDPQKVLSMIKEFY